MPQYLPLGVVDAPAQWTIPPALELGVEAVFASFDGSSAAGAFIPTLQIVSDAGETVVEVPQDVSVAAGASVVASWAPFLRTAPQSGGGSLTVQQGQYNAAPLSVAGGGGFGDASWTYVAGDPVLDLTTPTLPVAVGTGLYIISATFQVSGGGAAGAEFQGGLSINSTPSCVMTQDLTNPVGGVGVRGFVGAAVALTPGQFVRFPFFNNDSVAHNFTLQEAFVVFAPTS